MAKSNSIEKLPTRSPSPVANQKNGRAAAGQYDADEQGEFIEQIQTASAKLFALLNHISADGFDAFSESADQHGILWAAQGLAEELRDVSEQLMTHKEGLLNNEVQP